MPDQLSVFPDRFPACGPCSVTFKVYGYKRSQLAFSSACDCCYGDRCVTMAIRRGSIKEEHSGSDSHKKRWSVLGFFCRVCVCVTVIPWGSNPTNFDFSIMVGPFFLYFSSRIDEREKISRAYSVSNRDTKKCFHKM